MKKSEFRVLIESNQKNNNHNFQHHIMITQCLKHISQTPTSYLAHLKKKRLPFAAEKSAAGGSASQRRLPRHA